MKLILIYSNVTLSKSISLAFFNCQYTYKVSKHIYACFIKDNIIIKDEINYKLL